MSVTFTHLTADPRQSKEKGAPKLPPLETELTVPTTLEELLQPENYKLLTGTKRIVLGKLPTGKRNYVTLPTLVAAVVESMKLWQNAKVAGAVRPKQAKAENRIKAKAWAAMEDRENWIKAVVAMKEDEYLDRLIEEGVLEETA